MNFSSTYQSRKTPRQSLKLALSIAILVVGYVALAYMFKLPPFTGNSPAETVPMKENSVNLDPPKSVEKVAGDQAKADFLERHEKNDSSASIDSKTKVSIMITSAAKEDGLLHIRTSINGIDSEGVCQLKMTKSGSADITRESGTRDLGSYSVCNGFDIPLDTISNGVWMVEAVYSGKLGTALVSQEVQI